MTDQAEIARIKNIYAEQEARLTTPERCIPRHWGPGGIAQLARLTFGPKRALVQSSSSALDGQYSEIQIRSIAMKAMAAVAIAPTIG